LTKQAGKMGMDHSFFSRYNRLVVTEVNTMVWTTGQCHRGKTQFKNWCSVLLKEKEEKACTLKW